MTDSRSLLSTSISFSRSAALEAAVLSTRLRFVLDSSPIDEACRLVPVLELAVFAFPAAIWIGSGFDNGEL